ncbi:MAG: competence/damage-inducible protein A [bacterium]
MTRRNITAEIITVGNELLEGRIQDTNAQRLTEKLAGAGVRAVRRTTVGDDAGDVADALRRSSAGIVLVTGGLGPTVDDRTMEAASAALGVPLVRNEESEDRIRRFFRELKLDFHEDALKQAMAPEGAVVLPNAVGTAPGSIVKKDGRFFVFMPGVPAEMESMMDAALGHVLAGRGAGETVLRASLKTFGTGETQLQRMMPSRLLESKNPETAFLPARYEVEIRFTAYGKTEAEAREVLDGALGEARGALGDYVYGEDDDTLESVAVGLLKKKGLTLGCAESCSGGWLSSRLVSIPGASEVFKGSIVAYTTRIKEKLLRVPPRELARHGTVSEGMAQAMALQALERLDTDVGVSITGNAGPTAGDPWEEVGQVFAAVAVRGKKGKPSAAGRKLNRPRNDVRYISTSIALDLLRREILSLPVTVY